ncbi:hypothetical protein D1007_10805 [Hordeum vulgare]|nr:hypothetical protein D1007_10805 [Hordeum vulgare]
MEIGTEQIRTVDIHDSMSDPHPEDVGSEEELSPDSLGAAGSPSICSRLFVMKLCSVMSKFNLFKRELAKEIGFEGMLDLKPWQKINLKYIAYLMDRIDPDLSVINLESQGSIVLSEQSVHGIFGLPCGPKQITAEGVDPSESCIEYTRLAAMFSEKGTHSLKAPEFILLKEITQESSKIEKDCFKIALVVFVDGHVLAPSAKHDYITIDFWAAINNMEEASQWNWFGYVVKHLFVAVFVLDNMMLGELSKPTGQNPRIALYDYESVKKMVEKSGEKLGILLREHNARGLANAAELRQAFQASMFNFADKVVACIADTCTCCKSAGLKQCVLKTHATDVPATQDLVDLNYQTPVRRRTTGPADNIFGCGESSAVHESGPHKRSTPVSTGTSYGTTISNKKICVSQPLFDHVKDGQPQNDPLNINNDEAEIVRSVYNFYDDLTAILTAVLSNADPVYVQSIQKLFFTGIHEANPASCRMWHITAILEYGWALYSFDMVKKKVIVLDPAVGPFGYSNRRVKMHTYVSNKLHAALFWCINQFYSSWICSPGGWSRAFPILMNEKVARHESGLCTVFFAKNYDGHKLVIPLTRENLKIHKQVMLFELMRLEGNDSLLPQDALQAIKTSFCIL